MFYLSLLHRILYCPILFPLIYSIFLSNSILFYPLPSYFLLFSLIFFQFSITSVEPEKFQILQLEIICRYEKIFFKKFILRKILFLFLCCSSNKYYTYDLYPSLIFYFCIVFFLILPIFSYII